MYKYAQYEIIKTFVHAWSMFVYTHTFAGSSLGVFLRLYSQFSTTFKSVVLNSKSLPYQMLAVIVGLPKRFLCGCSSVATNANAPKK